MPIEVRLVQDGMAMQEGTLTEWFNAPGDEVAKGHVVAEVETEKTTLEIVAPGSGTLAAILVDVGQSVPPRTLLAVIATDGESVDDVRESTLALTSAQQTAAISSGPTNSAPLREPPNVEATPVARRLAKDNGLDVHTVHGAGPGGRITEDDVRRELNTTPDTASTGQPGPATDVVPLRGTRGRVSQRMLESLQGMAQFTVTSTADVTDLVRHRDALKASYPITYTHFVIWACALALREHPRLNAVIHDDQIRILADVNVGVAVALDEGLIVPVLRAADRKTLEQIVAETGPLIERARRKQATTDDVTGGTFTVSNLGAHGVDTFTPIINPPEVAILGAGRITERPVRDGDDGVSFRSIMGLSLTVDHRAIDGVPAAEFLQSVVAYLVARTVAEEAEQLVQRRPRRSSPRRARRQTRHTSSTRGFADDASLLEWNADFTVSVRPAFGTQFSMRHLLIHAGATT